MIQRSLIGYNPGAGEGPPLHALDPATGVPFAPAFVSATLEDLEQATRLAQRAFDDFGRRNGHDKAAFMRAIARQIEAAQRELVARAVAETALPELRLQNETARTCLQLRLFADLVEEGSWVDARLDRAVDRPQGPRKPDIRSMLRPVGPVAVFGASNFPLAFSVAGGDTAAALAAGCPVIVKAHPAHPGTSAIVGEAVTAAARATGMPDGVFSLLFDAGLDIGRALVQDPRIQAVGFTGSLAVGRQLLDLAAARPDPIPVYAEMGSANPVFLLPHALVMRAGEIAGGLQTSVTLGGGQFCTKPGLVIIPPTPAADAFLGAFCELMKHVPGVTMLTPGIAARYNAGLGERTQQPGVARHGAEPAGGTAATVFQTSAENYRQNPGLGDEIFGPATMVVRYQSREELLELARSLRGHLTVSIHGTDQDLVDYTDLIALLESKAGRVVINGYPTGVEVTDAMVHGGPYPATSSSRDTSVGTRAVLRFARPLCYQDVPESLLPLELHDANPLGIWRRLEGKITRDPRRRAYRARGRGVRGWAGAAGPQR